MGIFIGPRRQQLLAAWGEVTTEYPTGPHYDLTAPTRADRFQEQLDAFIADPTEETFEAVWSPDLIAAAEEWVASIVTNLWSGSLEELAVFLDDIREADEYDRDWRSAVSLGWTIPEVYSLCQPAGPIVSHRALRALSKFGINADGTYDGVRTQLIEFEDIYRTHAGHVTENADVKIPIHAEIDQLFRLVTNTDSADITAEATGDRGPLYSALEGYPGPDRDDGGPIDIDFDAATPAIDGHVAARRNEAYQDLTTEHWAGEHYESWKRDFTDYVSDTVASEYDVTDLSPDELADFFAVFWANAETYTDTEMLSTPVPQYLLGRWGVVQFDDFKTHCLDNPEEAASVLSVLFDEDTHLVDRLTQFHDFASQAEMSSGNLLRVATTFLMGVHPDRYINFQYERFNTFFGDCSSVDELEDGFDARQYYRIVLACQDLWATMEPALEDVVAERDPAMVEIHTLIRLYQDFKESDTTAT